MAHPFSCGTTCWFQVLGEVRMPCFLAQPFSTFFNKSTQNCASVIFAMVTKVEKYLRLDMIGNLVFFEKIKLVSFSYNALITSKLKRL